MQLEEESCIIIILLPLDYNCRCWLKVVTNYIAPNEKYTRIGIILNKSPAQQKIQRNFKFKNIVFRSYTTMFSTQFCDVITTFAKTFQQHPLRCGLAFPLITRLFLNLEILLNSLKHLNLETITSWPRNVFIFSPAGLWVVCVFV